MMVNSAFRPKLKGREENTRFDKGSRKAHGKPNEQPFFWIAGHSATVKIDEEMAHSISKFCS